MKILCDVHISLKITKFFISKGIDSLHINDILDKWYTSDSNICKYADENGYIVLSKDSDFRNTHFIKKSPKKLIKVNLGNIPTKKLLEIFENNYLLLLDKFDNNEFCYFEINSDFLLIINDNENLQVS